MKNSIFLISNRISKAEEFKSKILLLRNIDEIITLRHENCFEKIKNQKPSLIIFHLGEFDYEEDLFNLLTKIKQNKNLKTSSFLLIMDVIDENILCTAFEKGITDFLLSSATESEFTIRTLWCLKQKEKEQISDNNKRILNQLNIIDEKNDVFTEGYTNSVVKKESLKDWGTLAALSPDVNVRSKISPESLVSIIKKNIRSNDIIGYSTDFKIYLWFSKTSKKNVSKILEKIKENLTPDYTVSAGFVETKDITFEKAEELANRALSNALLCGNSFICVEETNYNKADINFDNNNNFKFNKQKFLKKLQNVLSPLFYQTKIIYEEKLFETKINQFVTEDRSVFNLKNQNGESTFILNYQGFTKIRIETQHDIKNYELTKNKTFIELEDLTEEKISYLLNNFIKDFQNYTNC